MPLAPPDQAEQQRQKRAQFFGLLGLSVLSIGWFALTLDAFPLVCAVVFSIATIISWRSYYEYWPNGTHSGLNQVLLTPELILGRFVISDRQALI
jgi:hypothetical protein